MPDEKVDAWMPLWIGAYLADTMHLSRDSHGGYLLLLFAYWRNKGPLADDDEDLAGITKATRAEWKALRPRLAKFFTVERGYWSHGRADKELVTAGLRKAAATSKAKAAAEARWKDGRKDAPSIALGTAQAIPKECPTPSPTPLPSGDSEANASAGKPAAARSPEEMAKSDLWMAAVAVLQDGGCKSEAVCRTFMGKLVGDYGFPIAQSAVAAAASAQPADAREYLKAACMRMKGDRSADHGKPVTVPSKAADETSRLLREAAEHKAEVERQRLARLASAKEVA